MDIGQGDEDKKILVFVFISLYDHYLGCSESGGYEVGRPLVYT
jgi:hypothetical protein